MMNLRLSLSSLICSTAIFSSSIAFAAPPARPNIGASGGGENVGGSSGEAAVGESSSASAATNEQSLDETNAKTPSTPSEPTKITSDGSPYQITDLGMTINPPVGWEVFGNSAGVSLVLKEPQAPVEYDKTMYRRNITVAAAYRGSPIDEKRASELKSQLQESFGKDASVSEFQVLEHKFFDYRGKNDGLLVYSSMKIGEEALMQMHILVSGGENQFLLTYTDLASRFNDQADKGFELAWNAMVSIEVSGQAPNRIEGYYKYFALAGGISFLAAILFFFRRKASKHDFDSEANELEDSNDDRALTHSLMATLSHGWKIKSQDGSDGDDLDYTSQGSQAPKSQFVSNY